MRIDVRERTSYFVSDLRHGHQVEGVFEVIAYSYVVKVPSEIAQSSIGIC